MSDTKQLTFRARCLYELDGHFPKTLVNKVCDAVDEACESSDKQYYARASTDTSWDGDERVFRVEVSKPLRSFELKFDTTENTVSWTHVDTRAASITMDKGTFKRLTKCNRDAIVRSVRAVAMVDPTVDNVEKRS